MNPLPQIKIGCIWGVFIATTFEVSLDNSDTFLSIPDQRSGETPTHICCTYHSGRCMKTEWFRGKWEIFWQINFIVFAVVHEWAVTKVCKYMSHFGFYEGDLFSDRPTFIKMSMLRDPDRAKCAGRFIILKTFHALSLVTWNHFRHVISKTMQGCSFAHMMSTLPPPLQSVCKASMHTCLYHRESIYCDMVSSFPIASMK